FTLFLSYIVYFFFFFFFFQAEDGIRDGHVTGVQTCALPISAGVVRVTTAETYVTAAYCAIFAIVLVYVAIIALKLQRLEREVDEIGRASCRKECRSRWSPDH